MCLYPFNPTYGLYTLHSSPINRDSQLERRECPLLLFYRHIAPLERKETAGQPQGLPLQEKPSILENQNVGAGLVPAQNQMVLRPQGNHKGCPYTTQNRSEFRSYRGGIKLVQCIKCQHVLRYAKKKIPTFVHADANPRLDPDGCVRLLDDGRSGELTSPREQ